MCGKDDSILKNETDNPCFQDEDVEFQVKKSRKELSSGTSALILLNILNRADEPMYGYQIAKKLQQHSHEKQGAIYPVLRNMAAKGLLSSQLIPSPSGPARKYFKISPLGKAVLAKWMEVWRQTSEIIKVSIGGASEGEKSDS